MVLASTDGAGGVVDRACPGVVFVMCEAVVVEASSPVELLVLLVIFRGVLDLGRVVRVGSFIGFFSIR